MKKILLGTWAAICTVCASTAVSSIALASEAATEQTDQAAGVLLTMDILQKVSLGIVITAVVLFLIFYIVKAVLKKLLVAPAEKGEEQDNGRK